MHYEEEVLRRIMNNVVYDEHLFKIYIGSERYIMGCISADSQENDFFVYKTIYDTIVDLDRKIKKSFDQALHWEYVLNTEKFNPVAPPSKEESEAIYYTENAIYRTSSLWDLLARLYNIKFKINLNPEKIYYNSLFRKEAQKEYPNIFAQQIYAYISEEENLERIYEEDEFWVGNHAFVTAYRNKMVHRNSPNVATASNYDFELRRPMRYVLKRVIEDYFKVSEFIKILLDMIFRELGEECSEI